jgi:Na+/H+-dicarboxylate symporter
VIADPVGALFVNALQMIVIPVVLSQLLAALVVPEQPSGLGALGVRALALFVALLIAASLFAVVVAPPALAWYPVDEAAARAIQAATTVPASVREAAGAQAASTGEWLSHLLPSNVFSALARGEILPLLLFTILVGSAINRLPPAQRTLCAGLIRAFADAMLIAIRWVLWLTPIGVFALAYGVAMATGLPAAGMIGAFVVIVSIPMLLFTVLLYPVAAVAGRVRLLDFARAVAPAQVVAVSTRSSIASLPALVEGARLHLRLPESATGFVLPLSVSTFKVNRTISATVKLLFLAHVFQTPITPGALVIFVATVIILSFTALGVPGGGTAFKTLPAYLAAGVPVEGIVILEAADAIPDIFKTLLNVTGDMTAATILSRSSRSAAVPAPEVVG